MKKLLTFICVALLFSSAFAKDISIRVTNNLSHALFLSANDRIIISPEKLAAGSINQIIQLKQVPEKNYFEIYFGKFPHDESCTFAYDIAHGITPAECPDFLYQISADGKSIVFLSAAASRF